MSAEYGDKFETPIIVTMLLVMLLSVLAVIGMNMKLHTICVSEYTYCGVEEAHH